jgi:hypothetical protein
MDSILETPSKELDVSSWVTKFVSAANKILCESK